MLDMKVAVMAVSVSALLAQSQPGPKTSPVPSIPIAAGNPQKLPSVLHFCAAHCSTLILDRDHFTNASDPGGSIWIVESFTRDSVVINRVDARPRAFTATYRSRISADGNTIQGDGYKFAWGTALNSIPGSDAERDRAHPPSSNPSEAISTPKSREALLPSMSEPTAAMKAQRADLNGDWEGYFNSPMMAQVIRIKQTGKNISAETLTSNLTPTGRQFFRGTYEPPTSPGQIELAEYAGLLGVFGGPPANWNASTITIGDPDHFRIDNRPPFQRIGVPVVGDIPCNPNNPLGVQAKYSRWRAITSFKAEKFDSAECWYYVGAVGGDSDAQGLLGAGFREGTHLKKNLALAFYWIQKCAEQGNPSGAITLADMYEHGEGTATDSIKAEYWRRRSQQLQQQVNKEALAEQRAETVQNQQLEALTRIAIAGAAILADPGAPGPCKVLARSSDHALTIAEAAAVDQARRQIAAEHIKCPADF